MHRQEAPLFKTALCMYYQKGMCTKGESCTFAHGIQELQVPRLSWTGSGNRTSEWKRCPAMWQWWVSPYFTSILTEHVSIVNRSCFLTCSNWSCCRLHCSPTAGDASLCGSGRSAAGATTVPSGVVATSPRAAAAHHGTCAAKSLPLGQNKTEGIFQGPVAS